MDYDYDEDFTEGFSAKTQENVKGIANYLMSNWKTVVPALAAVGIGATLIRNRKGKGRKNGSTSSRGLSHRRGSNKSQNSRSQSARH